MSGGARADAASRVLAACCARGSMPGATWWIESADGACSHGATGSVAVGGGPATEDTPYDLASLTKPLCTALLLVMLERDGRIDPHAPLGACLEELRASPYAACTLLDLALHRAGLPAWRPLYLSARGLAGFLSRIGSEPAERPRGKTCYSDLGYIVLGAAIARASGRGLDALFRERVAAPLGLRLGFAGATPYPGAAPTERGNRYERALAGARAPAAAFRAEIPAGRVHDGNAAALGGVAGHAGLFGNVAEVAALAREILGGNALGLDAAARRRLLREPAPDAERTVGWALARGDGAARGILPPAAPGHTGFTGTSVWLDPSRGGFCVLLSNRVHPDVRPRGFQPVRRAFHRIAASRTRAGDAGPRA